MAVVQIYAGKKSGVKKNPITSFGDYLGNPSFPYVSTDGFYADSYGVSTGSVVVNNTTGDSTTVVSIQDTIFIILDTQIFNSTEENYNIDVLEQLSDIDYTELDLFDDEPIEITQNVKDFKDVSKVLTDYTQNFKVPASKLNNRYFEHYYNQDIVDGFDARFRYPAIIKLNGVDWKEGQIRLTDVGMKDGYADNYEISFFGSVVSLKTLLGDDELDTLPYLDAFNHTLSLSTVATYSDKGAKLVFDIDGNPTGITTADFNEVPDLIYPFIGHSKNRYYVDNSDASPDIANVRNVALLNPIVNDQYHNILYTDLKPAVRVINIIRAIESKYGIEFSNDFIREDSKAFEMLYIMMSRESGGLDSKIEESSKELFLSDFSFSSGTEIRKGDLDYVETYFDSSGGDFTTVTMSGSILVVGSGSYSVEVFDRGSNKIYLKSLNVSGDFDFSALVSSVASDSLELIAPVIRLTTKGGISSFSTDLMLNSKQVSYVNYTPETTQEIGNYDRTANLLLSNGLDIRNSMTPKIKCIDFLKNIFKMFNIVAYVEDGVIVAKPYDDFYASGKDVDLSYCIDSSSHKVSRADIYSEINFKYKDPKDVITIKHDELTNSEYGNLDFKSDETTSFDGGKYKVEVGFSRPLSEGIVDASGDYQTPVSWGYSVSDSFSPVNVSSLIFTATNSGRSPQGYITDETTASLTTANHSPMDIYYDEKGRWSSINFGEEITPVIPFTTNHYTQTISRSLFTNFHENQILNLYNPLSRIVSYTCYPSFKDVQRLKLSDTVIINSKNYIINSMKSNLTTGKSDISLIAKSVELPLLEVNQFYELNKDGEIELFNSYVSYGYDTSLNNACSQVDTDTFRNLAIGVNGYVYRYEANEFVLQEYTGSPNFFAKLDEYTHDVIEIDDTGLIVNKLNCP